MLIAVLVSPPGGQVILIRSAEKTNKQRPIVQTLSRIYRQSRSAPGRRAGGHVSAPGSRDSDVTSRRVTWCCRQCVNGDDEQNGDSVLSLSGHIPASPTLALQPPPSQYCPVDTPRFILSNASPLNWQFFPQNFVGRMQREWYSLTVLVFFNFQNLRTITVAIKPPRTFANRQKSKLPL